MVPSPVTPTHATRLCSSSPWTKLIRNSIHSWKYSTLLSSCQGDIYYLLKYLEFYCYYGKWASKWMPMSKVDSKSSPFGLNAQSPDSPGWPCAFILFTHHSVLLIMCLHSTHTASICRVPNPGEGAVNAELNKAPPRALGKPTLWPRRWVYK